MKHINQKIIAIVSISVLLVCGIANAEIKCDNGVCVSAPNKEDKYVSDFLYVKGIKSIDNFINWVHENIKYKSDLSWKDSWASPSETLSLKTGDCEDFAFLFAAGLRTMGKNPLVIAVAGKDISHAICVFKYDKYYQIVDNENLIKTEIKTLELLTPYLLKKYKATKIGILKIRAYERI